MRHRAKLCAQRREISTRDYEACGCKCRREGSCGCCFKRRYRADKTWPERKPRRLSVPTSIGLHTEAALGYHRRKTTKSAQSEISDKRHERAYYHSETRVLLGVLELDAMGAVYLSVLIYKSPGRVAYITYNRTSREKRAAQSALARCAYSTCNILHVPIPSRRLASANATQMDWGTHLAVMTRAMCILTQSHSQGSWCAHIHSCITSGRRIQSLYMDSRGRGKERRGCQGRNRIK